MPVLLITEYTKICNQDLYAEYIALAEPIVRSFQGTYIARTNEIQPLSGNWKPERILILRFPSQELMDNCFSSPEYKALAPLRIESTESRSFIVEEYPSP
jgi:uncharacterized protein (DUF1330 family)